MTLKEKRSRVVVNMLDCVYLYEINAASGEVHRLKRFEKDYTIRGWPSESVRAMKDGAVKINGKAYTLEDVANGVPMDFLPERLQIEFTGTSADGKQQKHEWTVNVLEPADLPADPKEDE
ncbi:MAG: hypothetical protein HY360_02240 [Verrucomicrobia bacterium]|nr:hypothetical protein [Verrucomicrobiota bacterium]